VKVIARLRLLIVATVVGVFTLSLLSLPAKADEPCKFLADWVNGPCVVLKPSEGAVGTRVQFRAVVPPQHQAGWLLEWRRHPFLRMFKRIPQADGSGCMFIVPGQPSHWHLVPLEPKEPQQAVRGKALVGWLTIGDVGSCEGEEPQRVAPGGYLLSNSWRHGAFARFRVQPAELPATGADGPSALTALAGLLALAGTGLLRHSRRRTGCSKGT
jgi:LPXTG-motif cell wall-anchored protein